MSRGLVPPSWSRFVVAVAVMIAARDAAAGGDCLPRALKDKHGKLWLSLGSVGGAPVACVFDDKRVVACWDVDIKNHALHARAAAPLPGHSYRVPVVGGCAAGWCGLDVDTGDAGDPPTAVVATSTDGAHVAVGITVGDFAQRTISIYDASTRKRVRTFTPSISNILVDLCYVDDRVFVIGSDAGPFVGVWSARDDGSETHFIEDAHGTMFNISLGGIRVLDEHRVALTDMSSEMMAIVTARSGDRVDVALPPRLRRGCSAGDLESLEEFNEPVGAACKQYLRREVIPYLGAPMIAQGDGTIVVALHDDALGQLAILDARTMREKKRVRLPICKSR